MHKKTQPGSRFNLIANNLNPPMRVILPADFFFPASVFFPVFLFFLKKNTSFLGRRLV